jgi:hypothetical protein
MTKSILVAFRFSASSLRLARPAPGEQAGKGKHVLRSAASLPNSTEGDCETRLRKVDAAGDRILCHGG